MIEDSTEQVIPFPDSVRKRPAMYLGNNGIVGLIKGLISDCVQICGDEGIVFEIRLLPDREFSLTIIPQRGLDQLLQSFTAALIDFTHHFVCILHALATNLETRQEHAGKVQINFSIDEGVAINTNVDYWELTDEMYQISLLNRNCELLTIDHRSKHLNQNYFHFPEGILYLFEKMTREVLGKPRIKMAYDDRFNSYSYQIGIAYRTDWFPESCIASFANDIQTTSGGSLAEGVVNGLAAACRKFAGENNLAGMKITQKKLINGLIMICAVRGENLIYGGSFKESLESVEIKKVSAKITQRLVLDFFRGHKDLASDFFNRFDAANPLSGMY